MSRIPGPENWVDSSPLGPPRTPGSLGKNDAADPSAKARLGDTPGSLGVNDGAARLFHAAVPKAQLDPPQMAVVRATRQQLEWAKRECRIKAATAFKYYKAWVDSRTRLGPAGDPALRRTAEIEQELFTRQVQSLVKPAAKAYAEAIAKAVNAGCVSLGGSYSAEEALKRLLDLDALGQELGEEQNVFLSLNEWAGVLDKVASYILRICSVDKDPRGIKLAVMILEFADAVESSQLGEALSRHNLMTGKEYEDTLNQQQQRNPGIRALREFVDEMFSEYAEAH